MADRISEIKSLLDRLTYQLTEELEAQREEIQSLKERIEELEQRGEGLSSEPMRAGGAGNTYVAPSSPFGQTERPYGNYSSEETYTASQEDEYVNDPPLSPFSTAADVSPEQYAREYDITPPVEQYEEPATVRRPFSYTPSASEPLFTVTDLNDVHSTPKTTVSDLFAERNTIADVAQSKTPTWMVDIPGPKVEMIQSALTFNDRLTFIRELFDGDSEQFNITLDRINETSTFDEVVSDMRDAYPEWDEGSPLVYRFYMEVRRRFRD
jgi:hypothetical protein